LSLISNLLHCNIIKEFCAINLRNLNKLEQLSLLRSIIEERIKAQLKNNTSNAVIFQNILQYFYSLQQQLEVNQNFEKEN